MRIQHLILLVVASGPLVAPTTQANPIASTTYSGHTYELWSAPGIAWGDAVAAAAVEGGYLATLTDASETAAVYAGLINNGFFSDLAPGSQGQSAWLGGYTTEADLSTTDPTAWAWITGELWDDFEIANWGPDEPNGDSLGLTINRFANSLWNDEGGPVGGYIVEKEGVRVPDGGSGLLMLGGALLLLSPFARSRQR